MLKYISIILIAGIIYSHSAQAQISEAELEKYIMEHPEVIIKSVDKYYKDQENNKVKSAPVQKQAFDLSSLKKADSAMVKQILYDETNYSLGNSAGDFVIIEFFDYNCGWCKRTNTALSEVISSPEGKNIRWIPIDTPIFGEASELISRYVLAAGEQGQYAEMHKAVVAASGRLGEEELLRMAENLKLDVYRLKKDAFGQKIQDKLDSNNEYRKKLNINGVPMLIVDGYVNPGALIGDRLDAVIKLSNSQKQPEYIF